MKVGRILNMKILIKMKKVLLSLYIVSALFSGCSSKERNSTINTSEKTQESSEVKYLPLDENAYEILATDHNNTVENYYVLIKNTVIDKNSLQIFVNKFRQEYCKNQCSINIVDSKEIYPLITKYPLQGKEYIKVADHFVAMSDFSVNDIWMYPYQDIQYKEYGGKNWKKNPPSDIRREEASTRSSYKSRIIKECLSATSEDNFKELNRISNRRDENALIGMINAGKVHVLKSGTSINVIDRGFGKKLIETPEGLRVWVSSEFISE